MKMDFDLIVRQATPPNGGVTDLGILDGKIVAMDQDLSGKASREMDATGKIVMPGVMDAHVHFNEPGRTNWEGFETGSRSLAAGGGTCFFDMPLNSSPPVLNAAAVEEKRRLAEDKSLVDFAIWGGLTPDSIANMDEMAAAGVIGFKAFLCGSGLDEFSSADAKTLQRGMELAVLLDLPVAVHAEDDAWIARHHLANPSKRPGSMRDWLESRPVEAELAAIQMALELAAETGADLHVVHVSHSKGLKLITEAKEAGVRVTAETCPHYLLVDDEAACVIGPAAKCAPPLRGRDAVLGMWKALRQGWVDTIGSDHSPASLDLKQGEDVFAMWGGISGCQHGFELLCNEALRGKIGLQDLARMFSWNVARRFGLPRSKGGLRIGADADFFLLERSPDEIRERDLLYRHAMSIYTGQSREWRICSTWQRGEKVTDASRGRFLKPDHGG
ncbi:allantoinase AllB [Luteolibacter pohnpeiensis]|uniref:Allantoinase AllB n=1 Tax=Luteolibacter pohnpeiensis TaxID=454153 RepID=A0A934S4W2_9BACT|nr:allantoinase AllB [Luteolibacter pohnpeiensis]MBK1881280.1 allantoinase AllB [Luteolibacter pohnpeiensis]